MSQTSVFLTQMLLGLLLAPLLLGVINRVKAKFAGRRGKPLLQTYYDIARLLGKGEVISHTATWVFTAGPVLALGTTVCALALLPLGGIASPFSFGGDFLLAAYLLGLGRFALILSALDTGSAFEGMGASREATFSALAEPVLFLALLVLVSLNVQPMSPVQAAHPAGLSDLSFSALLDGHAAQAWLDGRAELLLIPAIFFILLLVENCRIPIDDPTTHLELTMIHEVMVLDHSGPNLAMIVYGAALKLWFFAALIAALLLPPLPLWQHVGASLALIFSLGIAVGTVESVMARLRLPLIPRLLAGAATLAALALILTLVR
ncbi:MAG: NADH-quinone oxidoreductase subunit H [Desulfovibrionaceae bacterium]|nr:NADH-quinone oxidoreductase subunit H [Desulfovibrionaceae bacterium]